MRVIIVEDEHLAAERLLVLLQEHDPAIEIAATLDCIEETLEWLDANQAPDLGFFDIQLADGLSFSIFEQRTIQFPVVFTTAFDQYALRAFEVNSIDYLLKPLDRMALERAFQKYCQLIGDGKASAPDLETLQEVMQMMKRPSYKERFVVKKGSHLLSIAASDIQYFYSENKLTWARLASGQKHAVDFTLEQLETMLDPASFFRLNRKYLAGLHAIEKATSYSNSRLMISLPALEANERVVISREKVHSFRAWFAGEA